MPKWNAPLKVAEVTEHRLLDAILDGTFPVNSNLPPERELAEMLGVTRPTLREALQRLSRDGWIEIRHGKNTRVKNYMQEGNLLILNHLARNPQAQPPTFVTDLLEVRAMLAPVFTRLAILRKPEEVRQHLEHMQDLNDNAQAFTAADLDLLRVLTILSGNPIYTLILNGFGELYRVMGPLYFSSPAARERSRRFYRELHEAAARHDADAGEQLTRAIMIESVELWKSIRSQGEQEA